MTGPDGSIIATAEPWSGPTRTFGFIGPTEPTDFEIIPGRVVHSTREDESAFYDVELALVEQLIIHCTVVIADPIRIEPVLIDLTGITVHEL